MLKIGREHGGNVAVVEPFQERAAFLANVLVLTDQRSIDKHSAVLFIGQGAFRHQTLDERLDGFRAPGCGSHQSVCDLIGADGRFFPDNFHNFKFSFGNLRQFFQDKSLLILRM